jgi:hypothetical protein
MKREKDMKLKLFFTAIVLFGIAPIASYAKESNTIELYLDQDETILWRTLESNTVQFPVNLSMHGAASAVLTIKGMRHKNIVSNITAETYSYEFPLISSRSDEDVYEVKLEYLKDGVPLEIVEKATLGSVDSYGTDSASALCRNSEETKWSISTGKVVLEIPYGTKALKIGEDDISFNGENTWYGWAPKSYGTTYDLILDDQITASVTPNAEGLLIICR